MPPYSKIRANFCILCINTCRDFSCSFELKISQNWEKNEWNFGGQNSLLGQALVKKQGRWSVGGDVKFLAPGDSPSRCTLARPQKTTTSASDVLSLDHRKPPRARLISGLQPSLAAARLVSGSLGEVLLEGLPGEDPQSPPPRKNPAYAVGWLKNDICVQRNRNAICVSYWCIHVKIICVTALCKISHTNCSNIGHMTP